MTQEAIIWKSYKPTSSSCHVQTFVGTSSLLIRHHFWQGEYDHHHIMGLSLPSWLKPTFGRDTSLILTTCEYSRPGLCQEDDLRNVIVHRRHPQHPFSRVFAHTDLWSSALMSSLNPTKAITDALLIIRYHPAQPE